MISGFFTRRLALLAAVSSALLLAACGGGDDNNNGGSGGQTSMRAINLMTDLASIDLYTGDTKRFSALATDVMAPGVSFEAATYALAVKRAGETTTLYSDSFSLSKDTSYTAVIVGRESGLAVRTIPESYDVAGITAGNFQLRAYNLTAEGLIDVFIVPVGTTITDSTTPTQRFTNNSLTDFWTFTTATAYRVLVTGQGNLNDVRLDITLTGVADKQFHTLVVTSGASGALINATLIPQGGTATSLKNTKARVRVAAGADANGNVSATVAGTAITGTLRSPNVSPYALVDAGDRNLTVSLNGSVISNANRTFAAGSDYTVLAFGSGGAPRMEVLTDDNRSPSSASTRAKIRLINVAGGSEAMTLRADFQPLVTDIAAGTASAYFTVASSTSARIEVTTPGAGSLYTLTSSGSQPLLQAGGVYTLFMLGGNAQPTGQLNKDR